MKGTGIYSSREEKNGVHPLLRLQMQYYYTSTMSTERWELRGFYRANKSNTPRYSYYAKLMIALIDNELYIHYRILIPYAHVYVLFTVSRSSHDLVN